MATRESPKRKSDKFAGASLTRRRSEEEGSVNWSSSVLSAVGSRKKNEDSTLCREGLVYGVFDGHGFHGAAASRIVRDVIESRLVAAALSEPGTIIPGAFAEAQGALAELAGTVPRGEAEFGTTASVAVVLPASREVMFAWAGDSRAMLCRGGAPVFAARLHTLHDTAECQRIVAAGGQVVDETDSGERRVIPPATAMPIDQVRELRVALGMSRALGHATLSKFGVSPVPEVSPRIPLRRGDRIVLATDGLHASDEDIARVACSSSTGRIACQSLATSSLRADKKKHRKSDNTTVLVALYDGHSFVPDSSVAASISAIPVPPLVERSLPPPQPQPPVLAVPPPLMKVTPAVTSQEPLLPVVSCAPAPAEPPPPPSPMKVVDVSAVTKLAEPVRSINLQPSVPAPEEVATPIPPSIEPIDDSFDDFSGCTN